MPHIRVRGLSKDQVQNLSFILAKELAPIMSTSEDNFTIEKVESDFFVQGRPTTGDPLIEVAWFEREQAVQDLSAQRITSLVRQISKSDSICVVFIALAKSAYYENGEHF